MKRVLLLSVLLCIVFFSFPVYAQDFSEYTPVSSAKELNQIRNNLDGKFYLTSDIVFTESDFSENGDFYNNGLGWIPIGDSDSTFRGILDGNGYKIIGLKSSGEMDMTGLFGSSSGELRNLTLDSISFTPVYAGGSSGLYCGLVAMNYGIVENCNVNGKIFVSIPDDSSFSSRVILGGICARSYDGSISYCQNNIDLNGSLALDYPTNVLSIDTFSGGIAGVCSTTKIDHCENYGDIHITTAGKYCIGGIVGEIFSHSVLNCINSGDLHGDSNKSHVYNHFIGGVVGISNADTENIYNRGDIEGITKSSCNTYCGGIAGHNNGGIRNGFNEGDVFAIVPLYSSRAYCGGIAGKTSDRIDNSCNFGVIHATVKDMKIETRSLESYACSGGILGYGDNISSIQKRTIMNCYNAGEVKTSHYGTSGSTYAAGIVSHISSDIDLEYCYNVGEISVFLKNDREIGDYYVGGIASFADQPERVVENYCCYLDSTVGNRGIIGELGDSFHKNDFSVFSDFGDSWEIVDSSNYHYPQLCYKDRYGHETVLIMETSPTCTVDGIESYWNCLQCDKFFGDPFGITVLEAPMRIPADHCWDNGVVTEKPTIFNTGVKTYTCEYCKKTKTESIPQLETDLIFDDVVPNIWYADAVYWAVSENITVGTGGTYFSPNSICTRGQMVTFLWRALDTPELETTHSYRFNDVRLSAYYFNAVYWAEERGVTSGTGPQTFSPDDSVTRGQVVTFLWREAGCPEVDTDNPFYDVDLDTYYGKAVLWAVANGITAGVSSTEFMPDRPCTRSEIVTFLYRYF